MHDQIEGCFPRNGKLSRPSVSDAGTRGSNQPAVAKMVPPTLLLMNWLVPSAPANQGRFPSDWVLKDPALFPQKHVPVSGLSH